MISQQQQQHQWSATLSCLQQHRRESKIVHVRTRNPPSKCTKRCVFRSAWHHRGLIDAEACMQRSKTSGVFQQRREEGQKSSTIMVVQRKAEEVNKDIGCVSSSTWQLLRRFPVESRFVSFSTWQLREKNEARFHQRKRSVASATTDDSKCCRSMDVVGS